jgi:putative transposase
MYQNACMARLRRLVLPGIPYQVTQGGNQRERTFFEESDYAYYRDLLAQSAENARTETGIQICLISKLTP